MSAAIESVTARVAWRDLVGMTRWECVVEATLPLPWLAASLYSYQRGWVVPGAICSYFVFLTGLRLAHGLQHYHLSVSRGTQDGMMGALSLIMLGSIHAIQATHLNHHRHCLNEHDVEGRVARWPAWKALLLGPLFPVSTHWAAFGLASRRNRRWIAGEILSIVGMVGLWPWLPVGLQWHVGAMVLAECLSGFFAVWTVHRDCDDEVPYRTLRSVWLNRLFYSMFFHAEHHLFPSVPTCHLAELSQRLDGVTKAYAERGVFDGVTSVRSTRVRHSAGHRLAGTLALPRARAGISIRSKCAFGRCGRATRRSQRPRRAIREGPGALLGRRRWFRGLRGFGCRRYG